MKNCKPENLKFLIHIAALFVAMSALPAETQTAVKTKDVVKIPLKVLQEDKEKYATILKTSEAYELQKVQEALSILKNVPPKDIDASCRNFTQLHIQSSYYEVNNFLMNFPLMQKTPELQKTAKDAQNYLLSITKKNKGLAPALDTLCTVMWLMQDFANMGYKKNHPVMKKHVAALMKLKIQDGWLQLQFTHKPGMKPEVEKTAKALVALLMAGYETSETQILASRKTLDNLLVSETNKKEHPVDWYVGVPWAMLLYKKIGTTNLKAYQKARAELIFAALQEPGTFHANAFMRGLTLMGLQGVVPESSYPYWKAKKELEASWNGKQFDSSAIVWSKEFNKSGRHTLMAAFALAGYGYGGKLFPFKNSPLKNCGLQSIKKEGLKIIVASTKQPVIEWTGDDFRTVQSKPMKKEKKNVYVSSLSSPFPFQIAVSCKEYYYFSGWHQ